MRELLSCPVCMEMCASGPPESLPREHAVVDVYWKFDLVKVIPISLFSASLVQHVRNNAHERHGLRNCPLEAEILARLARVCKTLKCRGGVQRV